MNKTITLLFLLSCTAFAKDTFVPINDSSKLPKDAIELWESYDPHAEPLEVRIVKEWKDKEVTTRYLTKLANDIKSSLNNPSLVVKLRLHPMEIRFKSSIDKSK